MRRINSHLLRFKECSRHIWNCYFLADQSMQIDSGYRFDRIEAALFDELVINALSVKWPAGSYRRRPATTILVVLKEGVRDIQVFESNELRYDQSKSWEDTSVSTGAELSRIEFISFFDWDCFGLLDNQFVQCVEPAKQRLLLIDSQHCDFYLDQSRDNSRDNSGQEEF